LGKAGIGGAAPSGANDQYGDRFLGHRVSFF
jgi:hypothetical protein